MNHNKGMLEKKMIVLLIAIFIKSFRIFRSLDLLETDSPSKRIGKAHGINIPVF